MSKKLILFINGLGGGKDTWGNFEKLIKEDESFKDFDVEFFTYKTNIFSLKAIFSLFIRNKQLPKIQVIAKVLKTRINRLYNKKYDEIYLITHSMGGLVAKKCLYDIIKDETEMKVKKLMLYAVPNNGSNWAKLSKLYSHKQIEQLKRDSDFIENLNNGEIKLEKYLDVLYVVGANDSIVDIHSAGGGYNNTKVDFLDKDHINIVKPEDSNDIIYTVFKDFLLSKTSSSLYKINGANKTNEPDKEKDHIKPTRESSPFVDSVYEALNSNQLVVCYSQDFNNIAKEYELLKGYMKYKFQNLFYYITVPSFINNEKEYFQGLTKHLDSGSRVESANDWKMVMKNILNNTDSRVLFIFSDIDDGDDKLNTLMARIIRALKGDHSNFYAICVGRKKLAYLVYGENKLSPLNTAKEIFFPINNQTISETKANQILSSLKDDRELLCECLDEDWSERWMIWHDKKSINELFWRGILINKDGRYVWESEKIKNLAKEIYSCDKI